MNYYRNLDRNWELMSIYENHIIDVPCLFATGKDDFVINMYGGMHLMGMIAWIG